VCAFIRSMVPVNLTYTQRLARMHTLNKRDE
jgi:hypothetical protein